MKNDERAVDLVEYVRRLKAQGIPEKDYKKQIGRYLEQKAREHGIPISGAFELTPMCNLDCKMCYVHLDSHSFASSDLLSVNDWKSLMQQAHDAGMRSAMLTGGECLTYPEFDELYLFLHGLSVRTDVLSNGLLLDEKRIEFFLRYRPQSIKISLYGSGDDVYEKVTGHRVFHKIYHNLEMMRDAKLPVYISITPNIFMKEDLAGVIETAESLNIRYEINARLFQPRENTGRDIEDMSLDQYVEMYRIRSRYHQKNPIPIAPTEVPEENHKNSKKRGLRCGAGQSSFAIRYDGCMCPCVSLDEFSVSALEIGFQSAWKKVNEYAVNYPAPCECDGCVYRPVCINCQAMHKNAPQIGHCDPKICERIKRLVQEGFLIYQGSTKCDKVND